MFSAGFSFHAAEGDKIKYTSFVVSGMIQILKYRLLTELDGWLDPKDVEISIVFISQIEFDMAKQKHKDSLTKKPFLITLDEIDVFVPVRKLQGTATSYTLRTIADLQPFLDLANALVTPDTENSNLVYNVRKLRPERLREVNAALLMMIYEGLKRVARHIGADIEVLDAAFSKVRKTDWFIEQKIGDIVSSRGKNPRRAQFIVRWEPDYIYHYARLFHDDGTYDDLLFMVYWRWVGGWLIETPGRLSWMNQDTLKFIPASRENYRFAFKVDQGPIDFSAYADPLQPNFAYYHSLAPRHRDGATPLLYLNYEP